MEGSDSTIVVTKAQEVPEAPPGTVQPSPPAPATVSVALPPNCRADGVIDQRVGVEGKSYAIGFAVALPDRWNGRFLFQGGGGLNGSIRPPLGSQAAGEVPALARGFAVVSTDSGHQGAVFDASFMKDQEAALNFASASVGKVTKAAKAIVAKYYGQPPSRSYFAGCSTGGREAMLASARYPEEFDGIVAGAPAMRTGNSNIGLAWANATFSQIAPKDAAGKPEPAKTFSAEERKLITSAILDACDAKDGVKDGLIFDGKACQFDPAVLTCSGAKTDTCLASPQVDALKKAFAGPKNSRGTQIYPAFPWDSGVAAEGVAIPGILTTGARSPVGPPVWESINVDQLEDRVASNGMDRLSNTAYWTNLTSFFGHGGKILFYHGVERPLVLGARHGELLRAHGRGFRWDGAGAGEVEPGLSGARHGALLERCHARSFRSAQRRRELGGRRQGAPIRWSRPARPFPAAAGRFAPIRNMPISKGRAIRKVPPASNANSGGQRGRVLSRMMISAGRRISRRGWRLPSIRSTSMAAARAPISPRDWRTVVRAGL